MIDEPLNMRWSRRRVGPSRAATIVAVGPTGIMPANRFEALATWYLRFNGYFTTPDFTVHPDFRNQPGGTDADVLAVRFPHSKEYQRRFVVTSRSFDPTAQIS